MPEGPRVQNKYRVCFRSWRLARKCQTGCPPRLLSLLRSTDMASKIRKADYGRIAAQEARRCVSGLERHYPYRQPLKRALAIAAGRRRCLRRGEIEFPGSHLIFEKRSM